MQVSTERGLGELLVRDGWVTAEQLAWAEGMAEETGVRYGGVLVAAGLVRRDEMYRLLARVWEADFVDLTTTSLDRRLLDGLDPHELATEGWYPVRALETGRHRDDGTGSEVLVATSMRPTEELRARIGARLGRPVRLQVTTDWDVLQAPAHGVPGDRRRAGDARPVASRPGAVGAAGAVHRAAGRAVGADRGAGRGAGAGHPGDADRGAGPGQPGVPGLGRLQTTGLAFATAFAFDAIAVFYAVGLGARPGSSPASGSAASPPRAPPPWR